MDRICVGEIVGVHGVKGLVKIKLYLDDLDSLEAYNPLSTADGLRTFHCTLKFIKNNFVVAQIEGISTREEAACLKGTQLHVPRSCLPLLVEENTYYHADLIGCRVETSQGELVGHVKSLYNFGAQDILEIKGVDGCLTLLPFSCEAVLSVEEKEKVIIKGEIYDEFSPSKSKRTKG